MTSSTLSNTRGRATTSLDGTWDFSFTGPAAKLTGGGHTIAVPGIWQAHFTELRNSPGTGTYRRDVDIPPLGAGQRLVLVFDGIFHIASVTIDGVEAGRHANAWTALELDVTDLVAGKQQVSLAVTAKVPDDRAYAERSFGTMLHGKQDWYGLQGGIWKSVCLEVREAAHFASLQLKGDTDLSAHAVTASGTATQPGEIHLAVSRNGALVAEQRFRASGTSFDLRMPVNTVELWSPASPALYEVEATLLVEGAPTDTVRRTIGFRRFEARDGQLVLNGEPFYLIGALDQDWHPEEECRAPDPAFLEQRFRNAKAMGLNALRCHVKIPDPLYFELADRLGILVWLDMPYMEFLAPSTRDQLVETFEASLAAHGHHPSICIWTIINEGWGIDLDDNPDDRRWLRDTFDALKPKVGPGSLLVDNSPCFPRNYHVKTDIEDFHWYNNWPAQNDQFERITAEFAARPHWSWSPHGDIERTGTEPLVCSEFGVWGLPHPRDIMETDGSEPWWFESGHEWNNGAGLPHGIGVRFRDAGLATVFGDLDGFVTAAQDTQYRALKHQIETLRYATAIKGYVITELNDTQWEANGIMDARNNPRAFGEKLAGLQTQWLVVARTERTALRSGETVRVRVKLCGPVDAPSGTTLHWRFGDQSGDVPLSGETSLTIAAGETDTMTVRLLELEARHDGKVLSANCLEFCIVPPLADAPAIEAADDSAAAILTALGYKSTAGGVLLATRLTTPVREALIAGRKVLLIANDADALRDLARKLPEIDNVNFPKMQIRLREGSYWDGRWMGAFSWRRTDGPWAQFPNTPMLDEHWQGLMPKYVLTGFRSSAFSGLVDSGVAVAWLHKAAAFSKRSFLGKGWMTATTFDFTSAEAQANPLAPHVLAALAKS